MDHLETVRRRKDGLLIDVSLTISLIREVGGRVVGASKIARDMTEKRHLADHGALKRIILPTRGFRTMKTAAATIKGFEVMRMTRRGQCPHVQAAR